MIDYTKFKPREILERACKVAGFLATDAQLARFYSNHVPGSFGPYYAEGAMRGYVFWYGRRGKRGGTQGAKWNPLTDLDQAIALQARFNLTVGFNDTHALVSPQRGFPIVVVPFKSKSGAEKQKAMQRAIALYVAVHAEPPPKQKRRQKTPDVDLYED